MSEHQPPSGTPEYLEYGGGSPIPPEPTTPIQTPGGRSRRRAWWIGGGAVALLGLGAGAWAALGFFQQGAQPAEALPSSTVAYLSIDLDPAGGQKIDAFRTLNKFPAFKDEVGVNSVDELRHKLGDAILSDSACDNLDYDSDIDPWLGDRAAVGLVALPGAKPDAVVVVQVKDDDAARAGIAAIAKCAGPSGVDSPTHFVVKNGWALLADDAGFAAKVADATDKGTLADDPTYQKWTDEVGEAGVVNAYASPDLGRVIADGLDGFLGRGLVQSDFSEQTAVASAFHATSTSAGNPATDALADFKGAAATLRFTGDGMELAAAGDSSSPQLSDLIGNTGGQLVSHLPDDTAAAGGLTFKPGWLDRRLDYFSALSGGLVDRGQLEQEFTQETGLVLPDDVETLLGSGVAISMSKDFDFEAAENSDDGSGLPVGILVKGDSAAIEGVLDKLRSHVGDAAFLGSDSAHGLVAIGPSEDYRQQLLAGGDLGGDDTFTGVVPHAGDAGQVFFANIDSLEASITKAAAGDRETVDNVKPLRAIGLSAWNDGDVARFSVKVSTN